MNKELFFSSTPHETKVGMVEDDLLAEIYLERENEYTLAGSIYKGRVTRVLPGMQSAFMELEDSEDLDEVPTNRPVPERYTPEVPVDQQVERSVAPHVAETQPREALEVGAENHESRASGEAPDHRGGARGRRP